MSWSRKVIVGYDPHLDAEVTLARVQIIVDDGVTCFIPSIDNADNNPEMAVRNTKGKILITETNEFGGRSYVLFTQESDGAWSFTQGVVGTIADGWLEIGSNSLSGKVVFDSAKTLDIILEVYAKDSVTH